MLTMGYRSRGTVFIQTISAATAQKIEQQKQQQHRVSAYSFVRFFGICNGICRTLSVIPLRSCFSHVVPVRSREFAMHPNLPLLNIIHQLSAILCVCYGIGSDFVVYMPIPSIINVIDLNLP